MNGIEGELSKHGYRPVTEPPPEGETVLGYSTSPYPQGVGLVYRLGVLWVDAVSGLVSNNPPDWWKPMYATVTPEKLGVSPE